MGILTRWRSGSAGKRVLLGVGVAAVVVAAIAFGLDRSMPDASWPDRDDGERVHAGAVEPGAPAPVGGDQLFAVHCASCHGSVLEGAEGPELGAGSDAIELSDNLIRGTILDGQDEMPSFEDKLTDEQIGEIIEFIRDVQAG